MLNPLLLWFLPLALVPIALHLITLYRLRTVELSTFRFLMDSYVQQRRRVRLLEYLLMILRTLFVLIVILAISRPVVERFGNLFSGGGGRDVKLVLDAGATTALRTAGTTSLDRAKATARNVMNKLGASDHVTVVRAGHEPTLVASGYADRPAPIVEKIEAIEPDITPADLPAALQKALDTPKHGPRVVYLLTDGQRRSLKPLSDHPVTQRIRDAGRLVVMRLGPNDPTPNRALLGEPPRTDRAVRGLPVSLRARLAAAGFDQPVTTRLSVDLDGEQIAQRNITIEPGRQRAVPLTVVPDRAGVVRGRFELPDDDYPADDQFRFVLNVQKQIDVLILSEQQGKGAQDPALYLRTALRSPLLAEGDAPTTSGGDGEKDKSREQQIAESIELTVAAGHKINEKQLQQADVTILAGQGLNEKLGRQLRNYVKGGGGLILLPGRGKKPGQYNKLLLQAIGKTADGKPLLSLGEPTGDPEDESTFQPIGRRERNHPVFTAFDDTGREYFSTVRFYRWFPVQLPEAAGARLRSLIELKSGASVLAEASMGRGTMVVGGFPATPAWSNLPLKPEFVPLLLRAVEHLRRPGRVHAVHAVRPHEPAPVRLSGQWSGAEVEVIGPDEKPHAITMHRDGPRLVGALKSTGRAGYYTVRVQPAAADAEPVQRGFAVNPAVDTASLAPLGEQQVRRLFGNLGDEQLVYLESSPEDPMLTAQLSQRREIWRWLIWATFLIIAIEFLLSTLKPGGAPETTGAEGRGLRGWAGRMNRRMGRTLGMETLVGRS